jgi:hypothetical protein
MDGDGENKCCGWSWCCSMTLFRRYQILGSIGQVLNQEMLKENVRESLAPLDDATINFDDPGYGDEDDDDDADEEADGGGENQKAQLFLRQRIKY